MSAFRSIVKKDTYQSDDEDGTKSLKGTSKKGSRKVSISDIDDNESDIRSRNENSRKGSKNKDDSEEDSNEVESKS